MRPKFLKHFSTVAAEGIEGIRQELSKVEKWLDRSFYVELLKQCTSLKAVREGRQVHSRMKEWGMNRDPLLCNFLVQMYGTCACLHEAFAAFESNPRRNEFSWTIMLGAYAQNGYLTGAGDLFHKMPQRNVVSWNSMIAAYAQSGYSRQALRLYSLMNLEGAQASEFTLLAVLDACSSPGFLARGREADNRILASGFMANSKVRNAVVNMYGKCESVYEAKRVFDTLPGVELVSWNTLVAVYGQNERLEEAKQVFDKMPARCVVSWNTMVAACVQNGLPQEALELFSGMGEAGMQPTAVTFVSVLDVCATHSLLREGREIHKSVEEKKLDGDLVVATLLINMYGGCGSPREAKAVFDGMTRRNLVSWNSMIAAYVHNGCSKEALRLLSTMDLEGFPADTVTMITIADACDADDIQVVHSSLVTVEEEDEEVVVQTAFLGAYAKCKRLDDAVKLFESMLKRSIVTWNSMLAGFSQSGRAQDAFALFQRMDLEGIQSGVATLVTVLEACSSLPRRFGRLVHYLVAGTPLGDDVFVGSSIVHMYGKCKDPEAAKLAFEGMCRRNVVAWTALLTAFSQNHRLGDARKTFELLPYNSLISWNAIIAAHSQDGCDELSAEYFRKMLELGVEPDEGTIVSMLDSCNSLPVKVLELVHSEAVRTGLEMKQPVASSLVKMYGRCRRLEDAVGVFERMPQQSASSWNVMICAYGQNGFASQALAYFRRMDIEGVKPDVVTYVAVVDSCSHLGSRVIPTLRHIHSEILQASHESDVFLANALINVYGKCGLVLKAKEVFDRMVYKSVVSWTSMVEAYGANGHSEEAFGVFQAMQLDGVAPDVVTFVCVLSSLSHAGRVDECVKKFIAMQADFGPSAVRMHG